MIAQAIPHGLGDQDCALIQVLVGRDVHLPAKALSAARGTFTKVSRADMDLGT
jgi:hypothetical protein